MNIQGKIIEGKICLNNLFIITNIVIFNGKCFNIERRKSKLHATPL